MDTVRPPKRKPVGGLVAEFESETVAHCLCHTALPFFDGGNINGYQLHSSKCQGSKWKPTGNGSHPQVVRKSFPWRQFTKANQ